MRKMIDMACEAGMTGLEAGGLFDNFLVFEALVRADEREACAKTKAGKPRELKAVGRGTLLGEQQFCFDKGWREGAASVRAAIRNRGNT